MDNIFGLTVTMFLTQLVFIYFRTLNVRYVATGNKWGAVLTGTMVHWAWLVGIAIGVASLTDIIVNWRLDYLPVIIASTVAGGLGTWWGMYRKKRNVKDGKIS